MPVDVNRFGAKSSSLVIGKRSEARLYGTLSEDDIDLIVGVDDDAIKLVKPKEKEENE